MTQKRHGDREAFQTKLRVYWQDSNGRDNYAVAQSVDISEKGLSIMIPNRIEPRTFVQVKADQENYIKFPLVNVTEERSIPQET